MKKVLLLVFGFFLAAIALIYFLIPSQILISAAKIAPSPDVAIERLLLDESQWPSWWPTTELNKFRPAKFQQQDYTFTLSKKFYKSLEIEIQRNNDPALLSRLSLIPIRTDSTGIEWTCQLESGNNPFQRINNYWKARSIKGQMDSALNACARFFSHIEKVYGINIERTQLPDTLFVTSRVLTRSVPNQLERYALINKIEAYIATQGTKPSGSPIYNVTRYDDQHFQLMAGLPVTTRIPEENNFSLKYMVKGSFMVTEVLGGESKVKWASAQLKQYFQDYKKTSMAMSFTMLVTDRMLQTDSSRWITRLYEPVY